MQDPVTDSTGKISLDIPKGYGDNRVVLMVRDPWTIYAYWEINRDVENNARDQIRKRGLAAPKSILRVYDVTESGQDLEGKAIFDFELKDWIDNWYVNIDNPGRDWVVDVGILCATGEYFRLARSNMVRTPAYGMTDVCDEEWMCSAELYNRMFAAAGGNDIGKSSFEAKEMVEQHLKKWLFSGGISSGESSAVNFFRGIK
ncbi:MAG: DUF4912 domain-containing protein [Candidatus Omnitrophota bacterium]